MSGEDGLNAWPGDQVQLAVQAIVLRANGYECDEGFVYYQQTRQRVKIVFTPETIATATTAISGAWKAADSDRIPPPLVDSPKCPGCSLVGICMPDEILQLQDQRDVEETLQYSLFESQPPSIKKHPQSETRLLVAPRADLRPLYLNSQGMRVGKSGGVLKIKERDRTVQEVRINEICQVNVWATYRSAHRLFKPCAKPRDRSATFRKAAGLRHYDRNEYQERRDAEVANYPSGPRMVLPVYRQRTRGREDPESAHATVAKSY